MVLEENKHDSPGKVRILCKMPFWQTNTATSSTNSSSSSSSSSSSLSMQNGQQQRSNRSQSSNAVSSVAKSLLPTPRRLRLDPSTKLYFPYEPGKQARSTVEIKNTSKSPVAFKFQTTAPKSCYMRPPGGILAPGENIIASVFKFVEPPENDEKPLEQKSKVKFKIMSLKVKGETEYVAEMFDELKDQVSVEQILRVVFLDPDHPSPALDKLKRQLAEADAALEAQKRPPQESGQRVVGEGLVINEWKVRRERYLAQQQVEGVDSV